MAVMRAPFLMTPLPGRRSRRAFMIDGDLVLRQHLLIDGGGDVRLEGPHRRVGGVDFGVAELVSSASRG